MIHTFHPTLAWDNRFHQLGSRFYIPLATSERQYRRETKSALLLRNVHTVALINPIAASKSESDPYPSQ